MNTKLSLAILLASVSTVTYAQEEKTSMPASGSIAEEKISTPGSDFNLYLGVRLWANQWQTWGEVTPTTTIIVLPSNQVLVGQSQKRVTSQTSRGIELTPIPYMGLKYKDFFASASYFAKTDYRFHNNFEDANRKEWDVTGGYYVTPRDIAQKVGLTLGYKKIKQDFENSGEFKISGPILGVIGSAPIGSYGFGLYGNFGYGWMNYDFPSGAGNDKDASYALAEFGFSYTYAPKDKSIGPLSAATATLGYRYQSVETDDVVNTGEEGTDTTKGLVLGVNLAF